MDNYLQTNTGGSIADMSIAQVKLNTQIQGDMIDFNRAIKVDVFIYQ